METLRLSIMAALSVTRRDKTLTTRSCVCMFVRILNGAGRREHVTRPCLFLRFSNLFFSLLSRDGRERDCKSPESCSWAETFNRIIRIGEISVLCWMKVDLTKRIKKFDKKADYLREY